MRLIVMFLAFALIGSYSKSYADEKKAPENPTQIMTGRQFIASVENVLDLKRGTLTLEYEDKKSGLVRHGGAEEIISSISSYAKISEKGCSIYNDTLAIFFSGSSNEDLISTTYEDILRRSPTQDEIELARSLEEVDGGVFLLCIKLLLSQDFVAIR